MKIGILGWMFLMLTTIAFAGRCEDMAKPQKFNTESAMEAIFCEYNREHGGTLIPIKNTAQWDTKNSESLATPILATTYMEDRVHKGVLAIQRQELKSNGEPGDSLADYAIISIYVFRNDGTSWVLEKGKMNVIEAGYRGYAPGGRLVKIGPDKHGILFEGAYTGQGYIEEYAFIINLSEQTFLYAGTFDTGHANGGTCTNDPKEQDEMMLGACWGYEGRVEFIQIQGSPYYMLRITYHGTEQKDISDREKITPKNDPMCYTFTGSKYTAIKDSNCAKYRALNAREIFGAADNYNR